MTTRTNILNPGTLAQASTNRLLKTGALVVGASLFMALCAHVSVPLIFSPVPITLQPFGILLIGMLLGSRAGAAALVLYLLEGVAGLPVFSPAGPGGILQLLGPTGGFLMASPVAAFVAGNIFESRKTFGGAILSSIAAEAVLFVAGAAWLILVTQVSLANAMTMAVLPYIPGEVLKVAAASAIVARWNSPGGQQRR
ncbi:MAG TPA: biotin transporter BioY [Terriglobales bacterium]|nr:biotin transporter BioY [Terriglobales bacterium]